jgi:hypothetical protein
MTFVDCQQEMALKGYRNPKTELGSKHASHARALGTIINANPNT